MKISNSHFYVIYTPGTVRLLTGLIFTLLKWSKAEFTLVSNACSLAEQKQLELLCDCHTRLHYKSLDSELVMPHGAVLNHLQSQNKYSDFGFIDSDIYAIAEFDQPFVDFENSNVACQFIAVPASFRLSDEIKKLKNNRLGCSYFMRYDNAKISQLRSEVGVHFDKYQWQSMPLHLRKLLDEAGLKQTKYDTARLLNAVLLARGEKLASLDDKPLRHLGGVSRISLQRQRRVSPFLESLISLVPNRDVRFKLVNMALDRHQAKYSTRKNKSYDKRARKRLVNQYFHDLLAHLTQQISESNANHLPALPKSGYSSVDQTVDQISRELVTLFEGLSPRQVQILNNMASVSN